MYSIKLYLLLFISVFSIPSTAISEVTKITFNEPELILTDGIYDFKNLSWIEFGTGKAYSEDGNSFTGSSYDYRTVTFGFETNVDYVNFQYKNSINNAQENKFQVIPRYYNGYGQQLADQTPLYFKDEWTSYNVQGTLDFGSADPNDIWNLWQIDFLYYGNAIDNFLYIDNFEYSASTAPVPIPGAALLLSPVLLGLVGFRRKFAA